MKNRKSSVLVSVIAMLLSMAMLVGTTLAWFSDSAASAKNIVQTGTLDVDLEYMDGENGWKSVKQGTNLFKPNALWEPGHTEVVYLRVANKGTLALQYQLGVGVALEVSSTNVEGDPFKLSDYIQVGAVEGVEQPFASRQAARMAVSQSGKLNGGYAQTGELLPHEVGAAPDYDYVALVVYMPESVGNEANAAVGATQPQITLGVELYATQFTSEQDAFGDDYDLGALFPQKTLNEKFSFAVAADENGVVTQPVTIESRSISVTVPAGVQLEDGVTELTATVTDKDRTASNLQPGENQQLRALDVHIEGIAAGNTVPVIVDLGEVVPASLNIGNLTMHHVENGATNPMTRVMDKAELDAHNEFYYEITTGKVIVALASFSEVTLLSNEDNAWNGEFDYSWYNADATELTIANADQLAAFGAIVGGMNGQTQDSFSGKTVKLVADINLGDAEKENNPDIIFYPIGYNSDDGKYEKTGVAVSTGFYSFMGTFDGNGHAVSNFYQNTWEMKGDHNWYDATLQYYRDGMGLFGRVYGGTVKNLTVKNFSSDGEITTTGVIAAYADGATFENIAITDCNPRVYNIGNGGIVGCVGWYAKEADLKTTFKNITVDNSNKISALWGSYDVACGGIVGQYYPTSGQTSAGTPKNAGIHFENCHISAQMDVYNDVCANYQYYAYRYTGMLIGSVRENETIDGHVYPKMDGITAENCTVHFGDWNDYYYCELVANSLASYTHDHQMSRLEQVASVDVANMKVATLKGEEKAIPTSGRVNYVVVNGEHATENATCYHFVDGKVWNHADAGTETVNGVAGVLKEDKQHIYLEFNNLVTGYGWGVTSKGVDDMDGVEILDRKEGNSVEKFEGKVTELANNKEYKLGDIFSFVDNGVKLVPSALVVAVTNLDENNPVSAEFKRDDKNWEDGTITFAGTGKINLTIQDYYFCTPTTITVEVKNAEDITLVDRFAVAFPNAEDLNRVGNKGTVALGKLFTAADGIGEMVTVTFETVTSASVDKNEVKATRDSWTSQTVQFSNTGVIKVTISDDNFSMPVTQYLEVVDAVNATGATNATANNVVLLNDIGSGFTVSGNYTVYGNGFTLNYTGNGQYLNNGLKQGVVTVSENGTLDNLRIKASIYPAAYLFYDGQVNNGPFSTEGDKKRYHYQLSAVAASDNATISNCYIYGARTNIFVNTGNVTIKDSVLECGTAANIQIQSTAEYTVTLENVTTIQYQVNPTLVDTSAVMLGAGVLVGPDTESNPSIVLNDEFKQYNWVTSEDQLAVSDSNAKSIIKTALDATAFKHTINGKQAANLGIIYTNRSEAKIENNTGLPYELGTVSILNNDGQVYSLQNATESHIYSDIETANRSTVNGDYLPTFIFDLGVQEISYDGSEDTRYLYGDANGVAALYQDGEKPLTLDLTKLATVFKYTDVYYDVTAVCKDAAGNALTATNGVVTLNAQGSYTLVFTVNDNIFYDKNGQSITKSVERTFTVPLALTVKEADVKNAEVDITKTALDGVYTTVNLTDYKLRINFLDCISVTDYDNKGTGTTVDLTSNISTATLTPSGVNVFTTASTATITYTDGRELTVNFSKISGSSPGTKTATINTSGGLYFITDGALNNKPTEASSQNKCTITSVSYKGNSGSTVINDTDVTVTWALGSSSGTSPCVTPDTLVTLADGTQKRIDQVTDTDQLLVWNFFKGEYAAVPSAIIFDHGYDNNTVIELKFSDGTAVKVVNLHQFFDASLNRFVSIDASSVADYVGHNFAKQSGSGCITVTLVDYTITQEYCEAWGIISAQHYNILVEGMLSTDFMKEDYPLFNHLEFGQDMKFDEQQMQADIEKYGLYTYDDFAQYLTPEQFAAFNVPYFKIPVGKGEYTYEGILALIDTYLNN